MEERHRRSMDVYMNDHSVGQQFILGSFRRDQPPHRRIRPFCHLAFLQKKEKKKTNKVGECQEKDIRIRSNRRGGGGHVSDIAGLSKGAGKML